MQQRYYDPRVGRFWSVDPVTVDSVGGNFNRYWYANNNPYRFTDPDGRMDKETRKEMAADHLAARFDGIAAAAEGANLAGLAMGVGEVVTQKEASAWSAIAAKGFGAAAAGAAANAADLAKIGSTQAHGGAAVSAVTGTIEAVTAEDMGDKGHGVAMGGLGVVGKIGRAHV